MSRAGLITNVLRRPTIITTLITKQGCTQQTNQYLDTRTVALPIHELHPQNNGSANCTSAFVFRRRAVNHHSASPTFSCLKLADPFSCFPNNRSCRPASEPFSKPQLESLHNSIARSYYITTEPPTFMSCTICWNRPPRAPYSRSIPPSMVPSFLAAAVHIWHRGSGMNGEDTYEIRADCSRKTTITAHALGCVSLAAVLQNRHVVAPPTPGQLWRHLQRRRNSFRGVCGNVWRVNMESVPLTQLLIFCTCNIATTFAKCSFMVSY